jgi:hypothetical protein
MATGSPAPSTPPLKFDPHGTASPDGAGGGVDADQYGNPLGGVRLPQIDVPVAQYQGTCTNPEGQVLIGTTRPFTDSQLLSLYPTFASYRTKMCEASLADVTQGTLLPFDAQDIDRRAKLARGRWPTAAQGDGTSARACAPIPGSGPFSPHQSRPPCTPGAKLTFTIHQQNGRVTRVRVYEGHRLIATRRAHRVTRITIPRPVQSAFALRIVDTTAKGKTVTTRRTFRGCAKTPPTTRVTRGGRAHRHRRTKLPRRRA